MSTVAIIGAGDLGAAAAQALASSDRVRRIVLIDAAAKVAEGKALDMQQAGAVEGHHARLAGTDDLAAAIGAAVCIVADRQAPASEWQGEEALAMLGRLIPFLSGTPLVFAGARQAELMLRAAKELGVQPRRLVGSAPDAFASAVRSIVAVEAQCSPNEVTLAVLGAPPAGLVVPWSEASIGGFALERVLSQVQITRVEGRAARLWPPGPYTLGVAAARMAEAIITSSRRRSNALTLLGGEFGVRNRIGALPVLLNSHGIADVYLPTLNSRERVKIQTALQS